MQGIDPPGPPPEKPRTFPPPVPVYNPYAPPARASSADPSSPRPVPYRAAATKWVYLGLAGVLALAAMLLYGREELGIQDDWRPGLVVAVELFVALSASCGLVWLYQAWSVVDTNPGGAVGRHFIPIYGMFWLFICQQHLCSSIDSALAEARQPGRGPRDLAVLGPGMYVAAVLLMWTPLKEYSLLVTVAERGVWFLYMLLCDRAIVRILAARAHPFE
jgi:hypothetical protein